MLGDTGLSMGIINLGGEMFIMSYPRNKDVNIQYVCCVYIAFYLMTTQIQSPHKHHIS